MKTKISLGVAVLACLGCASAAQAGTISIDALGGPVVMHSGDLSGLFAGAPAHDFTNADVTSVHQALHADGVSTDGMVTFLLADTSDGLSFVTLMDDITQTGSGSDRTYLSMSTTAADSTDYFINDLASDVVTVDEFAGTTTVSGTFEWLDARGGDGFAWTSLQAGDAATFNFSEIEGAGLDGAEVFQFVTWNGDAWEVVAMADFTGEGQFSFTFTVVPLPAPVLLGLAGLAGVAIMRRRKNR